MSQSPPIALITCDVIGQKMAGTGIRCWEFARVLGQTGPVRLIVPPTVPQTTVPDPADLPTTVTLHICLDTATLRETVQDCAVIVTLGLNLYLFPFLTRLNIPVVFDSYVPQLLEDLERGVEMDQLDQLTKYEDTRHALIFQLQRADFILCASKKQRDYWLGMLSSVGRVNPFTYQADPTLRQLIDVVSFGLPPNPAPPVQPVLKGVHPQIATSDKLLLWGGGLWNWFDAPTLLRAMAIIGQTRQDVKLFFMGIKRANRPMQAVAEAQQLSDELGLTDRTVFFNDWVPYAERHSYLMEADLGVSLHREHVETRFSFRTRLLDCVWTGLPILSTAGDSLSDDLAQHGVAFQVPPNDPQAVADTIARLLDQSTLRADLAPNFVRLAEQYRWAQVMTPLTRFCADPAFAPDRDYLGVQDTRPRRAGWEQLQRWGRKGWQAVQLGGARGLGRQVSEFVRWQLRERIDDELRPSRIQES